MKQENLIILRTIRYGDSDLILHALNREGSQIHLFAKAALKSKKRFGGGILEPTHYILASFSDQAKDPLNPLYFLKEASLIESFAGLRTDLSRLNLAFYFLKLISKFSVEGSVDSYQLFDLLGNALKSATQSLHLQNLKTHFEIKVLAQHGILPSELHLSEWLNSPIKNHESISITSDEHRFLKMKLDLILKQNHLSCELPTLEVCH